MQGNKIKIHIQVCCQIKYLVPVVRVVMQFNEVVGIGDQVGVGLGARTAAVSDDRRA